MTINLAAIFGPETTQPDSEAVPVVAENPLVTNEVSTTELEQPDDDDFEGAAPWPIVEGTEHWNPYIDPADLDAGRWGQEFVPWPSPLKLIQSS